MMTPGAVNFDLDLRRHRFNGAPSKRTPCVTTAASGGIISNNPSNIGGEIMGVSAYKHMENAGVCVDASNHPPNLARGGGQISIITKSGGNAYHGSPFEYFVTMR
jgi:hypothetical protein